MRQKTLWTIIGLIFFGMFITSLAVIHYQLTAAWRLRWIDEQLQINTRFKTDDISQWLQPSRTVLQATRWGETPAVTTQAVAPDMASLYTCCVEPHVTVEEFKKRCVIQKSWPTAHDIRIDRENFSQEMKKALKTSKIVPPQGKPVRTASGLIELLEQEFQQLQGVADIARHYRAWGTLYTYTEYPQQWLFKLLRLSYYTRHMPHWVIGGLNHAVSWWVNLQLPAWIHKAKVQTKQNTWWIFHGHVDRKITRMTTQLQEKIDRFGYIHDYWPYYQCLMGAFDLEVKDVSHEVSRLIARNRELLACAHQLQ